MVKRVLLFFFLWSLSFLYAEDIISLRSFDSKSLNKVRSVSVVYSPKIVVKEIRCDEKDFGNFSNDQHIITHKIPSLLSVDKYPFVSVIYEKNQQSNVPLRYQISLKNDQNDSKQITFLQKIPKIQSVINMQEVSYKPKDKIYLFSRLFGLGYDDLWYTASIPGLDLIQRRFSKKLTFNDSIEIHTKLGVKLNNIVFGSSFSESLRVKNKLDIAISFLKKIDKDDETVYVLDINKFLRTYYPQEDLIYLTELQIFKKDFKPTDIKSIHFVKNYPIASKDLYFYDTFIERGKEIHSLRLDEFRKMDISSLRLDTDKSFVLAKVVLFNIKDKKIPFVLDKNFDIKSENELKFLKDTISELKFQELLKGDRVLTSGNTTVFPEIKYPFFEQKQLELPLSIENRDLKMDLNSSLYFDVDGFIIKNENFNTLSLSEYTHSVTAESSPNYDKIVLKLIFMALIGMVMFIYRKAMFNIIRYVYMKLFHIFERSVHCIQPKRLNQFVSYGFMYLFLAMVMYGLLLITTGVYSQSLFVSFGSILLTVSIIYFVSFGIQKFKVKNIGIGNIYFEFGILFLLLALLSMIIKIEIMAEQFSMMSYYVLVWGTYKEIIKFYRDNNG